MNNNRVSGEQQRCRSSMRSGGSGQLRARAVRRLLMAGPRALVHLCLSSVNTSWRSFASIRPSLGPPQRRTRELQGSMQRRGRQ